LQKPGKSPGFSSVGLKMGDGLGEKKMHTDLNYRKDAAKYYFTACL
jgi:hypothetical protein